MDTIVDEHSKLVERGTPAGHLLAAESGAVMGEAAAEVAVDAALAEANSVGISDPSDTGPRDSGIRRLGAHMLSLIDEQDASDEQRTGARIILMSGTPAERRFLFLLDATQAIADDSEGFHARPGDMLRGLDSARALAEVDNETPAVRTAVQRLEGGAPIAQEDFVRAIGQVLDRILPQLAPEHSVALLRHLRRSPETRDLLARASNESLAGLLDAIPALAKGYDQVLVASSVIGAAVSQETRARSAYHSAKRSAKNKLDQEVRAAQALQGAAYDRVPGDILEASRGQYGERYHLNDVLELGEAGLQIDALLALAKTEPGLVARRNYTRDADGPKPGITTLNDAGNLLARDDELSRAITHHLEAIPESQRIDMLGIACDIVAAKNLSGLQTEPNAVARLARTLVEQPSAERAIRIAQLDELASKLDISRAAQIFDDRELFTLTLADDEKLAQLSTLLRSQGLVELWKKGHLTFYAGSDHSITELFNKPAEEEFGIDRERRALYAEVMSRPEIAALADEACFQSTVKVITNQLLTVNNIETHDTKIAEVNAVLDLIQARGVADAVRAIHEHNPALMEKISLYELALNADAERIATLLESFARLPTGFADADLIAYLDVDLSEMVTMFATLQNFGIDMYVADRGMFKNARAKAEFYTWFASKEGGSPAEKAAVLWREGVAESLSRIDAAPFSIVAADGLYHPGQDLDAFERQLEFYQMASENPDVLQLFSKPYLNDEYTHRGLLDFASSQPDAAITLEKLAEAYRSYEGTLANIAVFAPGAVGSVLQYYLGHDGSASYLEAWRQVFDSNMLRDIHDIAPQFTRKIVGALTRNGCDLGYLREWHEMYSSQNHLLDLISESGPLFSLGNQILGTMISSQHPAEVAARIYDSLTTQRPLWLLNMDIAKLATDRDVYASGLHLDEIPIALPAGRLDEATAREFMSGKALRSIADMSIEEKRMYLAVDSLSDEQVATITTIEYSQLVPEFRENLLAYRLFEAIELSRSQEQRRQASDRNMAFVYGGGDIWELGALGHFTQMKTFSPMLINGNLAGETAGMQEGTDDFPFNVDFVVTDETVLGVNTHAGKINALASHNAGPICLHFRRGPGAFYNGEEYPIQGGDKYKGQQRLLFGAIPITELSAISVQDDMLIEPLSRMLVETGLYAPIYNTKGELVFRPADYQRERTDRNYDKVRPEIIDGAFIKLYSQGGLNEGAEMYFPTPDGPEGHYVKFAANGDTDHLWTELETDDLRRLVNPEQVPDTRAVIIDGRPARASKLVEVNGVVTKASRNAGFIVDVWLSDFDAVRNPKNLVPSKGEAMRIDGGSGLDYMPDGSRKTGDMTFGPTVPELELGNVEGGPKNGMRHLYPGLTDEQIQMQVRALKERATDDEIDRRVDRTRRTRADREYHKRTLKARRDYIIDYYSDLQTSN